MASNVSRPRGPEISLEEWRNPTHQAAEASLPRFPKDDYFARARVSSSQSSDALLGCGPCAVARGVKVQASDLDSAISVALKSKEGQPAPEKPQFRRWSPKAFDGAGGET